MVLDASTAAQRVLCIYPWDGNSMAKHCNGDFGDGQNCIPGCSPVGSQCQKNNMAWGCSYPPERLDEALRHHSAELAAGTESKNNEVILDTRWLSEALPGASNPSPPEYLRSNDASWNTGYTPLLLCFYHFAHKARLPGATRVLRSPRFLLRGARGLQPDRWEVDLRQST